MVIYSSKDATTFNGLTRGAYGTIAASHSDTEIVTKCDVIPVDSASSFGNTGNILIDKELIYYVGKDSTNIVGVRGVLLTDVSAHSDGVAVTKINTVNSFDAAFGDLDGDSAIDIVVANGDINEDTNKNGVLDTDDTNGNGVLDTGEDINGNGVLDTEDTDGDGVLDTGQANEVYLNDGTGNFTAADSSFFPAGRSFSTAVIINNLDGVSGNEVFVVNAYDQQNKLYSAGLVVATASISGTVTLTGGSGAVTDVTVTLSGGKTATTNPGSDGKYSFTGLEIGKDYTVAVALTGYTFTPSSKDFTNLSKNETQDFSDTIPAFSITTTSLPDGKVGVPYNPTTIEVAGGTPPYKLILTGALPAGLKFNKSTGEISGTPKKFSKKLTSKVSKFKVTARDSSKPKKKTKPPKPFTITISQ